MAMILQKHWVVRRAVLRIRPKTMTVMTTIVGLLPGAETMKRMAGPTFGALLTSFTMELLIDPVIFLVTKQFYRGRRQRTATTEYSG